jgi:hypothetical protein
LNEEFLDLADEILVHGVVGQVGMLQRLVKNLEAVELFGLQVPFIVIPVLVVQVGVIPVLFVTFRVVRAGLVSTLGRGCASAVFGWLILLLLPGP